MRENRLELLANINEVALSKKWKLVTLVEIEALFDECQAGRHTQAVLETLYSNSKVKFVSIPNLILDLDQVRKRF